MKWIDIKKQQPKDCQQVLITNGRMITAATADLLWHKGRICWGSCHWKSDNWEWDWNWNGDCGNNKITHWMPLPELPVKQCSQP